MLTAEIMPNGQIIVTGDTVSDSVKHEKIKFLFPDDWKDYSKTAVFAHEETVISIVLSEESELCTGKDECYVPFEVIKPPFFTVSVFGSSGDTLATTQRGKIKVEKSGYEEGDEPSDPTPGEYQQITEIMNNTQEIAQSVRDDADRGVFDGEDGANGEDGFSPVVSVTKSGTVTTITVTDKYGTDTATVNDGPKGDKGDTGEQGPQGPKGDKGDKGDDAITDQTYDPTSENAQSGTAVAEAVADKQDKLGNVTAETEIGRTLMLDKSLTITGLVTFTAPAAPKSYAAPFSNQDLTNKVYVDGKAEDKEDVSNKVTSISSSSTDTQYPSAKCVYDLIGDIETLLQALR